MLPLKRLAVEKKWTYQKISDHGRAIAGPGFPSMPMIAQYACGMKRLGKKNGRLIYEVYHGDFLALGIDFHELLFPRQAA